MHLLSVVAYEDGGCVESPDGQHCRHWWDDPLAACCFCGRATGEPCEYCGEREVHAPGCEYSFA